MSQVNRSIATGTGRYIERYIRLGIIIEAQTNVGCTYEQVASTRLNALI